MKRSSFSYTSLHLISFKGSFKKDVRVQGEECQTRYDFNAITYRKSVYRGYKDIRKSKKNADVLFECPLILIVLVDLFQLQSLI